MTGWQEKEFDGWISAHEHGAAQVQPTGTQQQHPALGSDPRTGEAMS